MQPTFTAQEIKMEEVDLKYNTLKIFKIPGLAASHPSLRVVFLLGDMNETDLEKRMQHLSMTYHTYYLPKFRSKSDKEILKVSNLIANTFHFMFSKLPVTKSSCLWKFS